MLNVTASLATHFSLSHGELEEAQPDVLYRFVSFPTSNLVSSEVTQHCI